MFENDTITIRNQKKHADTNGPTIKDPTLRVEQIVHLDNITTGMAFLSENDILVLEKNNGTVQRVVNGKIMPEPVLDVDVANKGERGMLGIAIAKQGENKKKIDFDTYGRTYVYLFFTESGEGKDGTDFRPNNEPLGSRLYRYEFSNNKLISPKLLLDLPAITAQENTEKAHYGGKVLVGPDRNIYVGIGEVGNHRTLTENNITGGRAEGTGGILRVTYDGRSVQKNLLGSEIDFLKYYYAYGIRNTFGMDFDPITGILWDTENGPKFGDEINFVEPGFNSGWKKIHGIWNVNAALDKAGISPTDPNGLVDFNHKGKYSPPEFVWDKPIGVTALKFFNSTSLGINYENSIFVGDVNLGYLYNFKLNPDRMSLLFDNSGPLSDKVADTPYEMQKGGIILGKGFGTITEIQVGPDGNLYVLNLFGDIYRISSISAQ
jgi:glucose/arabinose dehydrogenase